MLFWFLLGFAVLAATILFATWYAQASPRAAKRAFKIGVACGVVLAGLLALALFGAPRIAGVLALLASLAFALRGMSRRARATQGPSPGGASSVRSDWFEMSLDHDGGDISGVVLQGAFEGASLDDLTEAQLDDLAQECAGDLNSRRLLEAYLARRFGRAEQDDFDGGEGAADPSAGMTEAEARQILGVDQAAGQKEINAAYKRLIATAHPDRGGSAYLAAKINEARDLLLGRNR